MSPMLSPDAPGRPKDNAAVRRTTTGTPMNLDGSSSGRVTLVGAGPGDPELLTVKAVRAIRSATVLLVDDLVGDGVLKYVRRATRVVHVGKRGGCASTPQAFIEKLMAAEARNGERVVRLKGGDPFVFGRGGEEADHLRAQGIAVDVVNGITAGLAAAAALGTPLTHRDHAHGVLFVTGHEAPRTRDVAGRAALPPLHWPTLAAAAAQGMTLVVYMGMAGIRGLQDGLLQGLPPGTPAAVVQHASLPVQRSWTGRLGGLADAVAREALGSPAVIIVGNVLLGLQQMGTQQAEPAADRAA